MGISPISSSGSGNPDPTNFSIHDIATWKHYEFGELNIVRVNYPDCNNYEGNKILIFEGKFQPAYVLDPHFSPENSLIMRVEPTYESHNLIQMLLQRAGYRHTGTINMDGYTDEYADAQ